MLKNHYLKFLVAVLITAVIAGVGFVPNVAATTETDKSSVITIDCTIDTTTEWAMDEDMGLGDGGSSMHFYLTWDSTYLYLGLAPIFGDVTIYLDTAPGGTNIASFNGTHSIAGSGAGYEYAYSNDSTTARYEVGTSGSWTAPTAPPAGTSYCIGTSGPHIEWRIPWANINGGTGVPSYLTVLATSRTLTALPDTVVQAWPFATGNDKAVPVFSQGYVFNVDNNNAPGTAGISPNAGPTAISLSQFTANNPQLNLLFITGLLVVGTGAFLVLRRRTRKQEI